MDTGSNGPCEHAETNSILVRFVLLAQWRTMNVDGNLT